MSKTKWIIVLLIVLAMLELGGVGFITYWRQWFWQAVQDKQYHLFWIYIMQFSGAALALCLISGYSSYFINRLSNLYRSEMTHSALEHLEPDLENYNQRIQEDCKIYPQLSIGLIRLFLSAIVQIGFFLFVICQSLPFWYCLVPIAYSIIGTLFASRVAKPLVKLNYDVQNLEASFRNDLTIVRYLPTSALNVVMFKVLKRLTMFQSFYNQITVIVPYLLLSPLYFTGGMHFGVFMQVSSTFNSVTDQFSGAINSFSDINQYLACRRRLKECRIL